MTRRDEEAGRVSYGIEPSGYRLPGAARVGRIRLQVADLARSLEWYVGVLGMRVQGRTGRSAILGAPGGHEPGPDDQRPGDHSPGNHSPDDHSAGDGDHSPGDHSPGDHGPGDHVPGDHGPGDHVPGDHGPGDLAMADRPPFLELRERPGASPVPRGGRLGLYHYAILLQDRAALGRFASHLSRLGVRAGAADHRVSEALYLQDPDGLGIEVYADRPRTEWRHEAGQLVMATDPLDLRGVMDAAGGEPWTGMPAGTVIGHVHLHVGDLARAEAFYHEALGLDKVVWSYPGALFLSAGGYHHHLGVNTWAAGAGPAGENEARLLDWEIVLPTASDVRAAAASLGSAGHDVAETREGSLVPDPWGTVLRITAAST
jgi:catechol 2,3-dioxygenase